MKRIQFPAPRDASLSAPADVSLPPATKGAANLAIRAFTAMELLVTGAILIAVIAIVVPVYSNVQRRAHKQVALEKIRTLGSAVATYATQNAELLPAEDTDGNETWYNVARPIAKDAWYNALPRLIGKKGADDYESSPASFYEDENILFLPGANYPDKKKLLSPQFAIAFNTKLQRNDAAGKKERTRRNQITDPARTIILLEQGTLNEDRTLEVQSRNDYDGAPKGRAKSFVGRYGGMGVLGFLDGHVELVAVKDALTETGHFPFPQSQFIWTRTPDENPNKDGATVWHKKK